MLGAFGRQREQGDAAPLAGGLGLLAREAGLDGDAHAVDPDHLAGFSPAVAVAPPLGPGAPVVER